MNNIATVLETHGCHVLPGIHEMCKIKIVGKRESYTQEDEFNF